MTTLRIHAVITCPHCWFSIHPADFLWVSKNRDLKGDSRLGSEALKRFLPSRFDVNGFALDESGERCESIACPNCHLVVPRILCETWPLFLSILGAPGSGKSYFLASCVWQARQRLYDFHLNFSHADPAANQIISRYEQKLFLNEDSDQLVAVLKTEEDGELYQKVDFGERQVLFAKPFVFSLRPEQIHPFGKDSAAIERNTAAVCLYDNAGEHFLPDTEAELSPATNHLALSKALLFIFDPIQHPNFRRKARQYSSDPQLEKEFPIYRQDEILLEAAKRIRKKTNLAETEKVNKPLVVVVNKYDVWAPLVPKLKLYQRNPFDVSNGRVTIDHTLIKKVSKLIEQILRKLAPEIVTTCRSFSQDVTFIPVSPLGNSPEVNQLGDSRSLGVRPKNIAPIWAEVPLLYAISRTNPGLVPATKSDSSEC